MYKQSAHLYYSPSDLSLYMESPFASWMNRLAIERPEQAAEKDPTSALMSSLAAKGYAHESAVQAAFIEQGKSLITIEGSSNADKRINTLQAMRDGIDVIVQARLEHEHCVGYADFLVKVPHTHGEPASLLGKWHYEVWDAKLAKRVKPTFVIQLCCYVQMLEPIQGHIPEFITVALGNGDNQRLRTSDLYYYYQALQASFLQAHNSFDADNKPDPAASRNWGPWSQYAERLLLDKDHLFQVARISTSQIQKFNQAGIDTMQQLADSDIANLAGIHSRVHAKHAAQAALQVSSKGRDRPEFTIIQPEDNQRVGLALLPPHSPLDVFFDIEGYPFDEDGLEYLWGCAYFNTDGRRDFIDFWAHNKQQEKKAFVAFIDWVYQRWQQDPKMHIYHYANYEIAACRRLMGRYGVCEDQVDQLLRNEVFVDLYTVVTSGVLVGEPRYSIKNIERLYRGKRDTAVGDGVDSIMVYEQWRESHQSNEQGDTWRTSSILNDIRDYNIDDCNSTQELVDWLRQQQHENAIAYLGEKELIEPEVKEEITQRTQLRDRLLTKAESERDSNPVQAQLSEHLAWTLEFHRRELKPVFWRLFERLGLDHEDLLDDADCFACCQRTEREAWKLAPRKRNLAYEYSFDTSQEFKGGSQQFIVLGVTTEEGKQLQVTCVHDESDLDNGLIVIQSKIEPPAMISLIPKDIVNPEPIAKAIYASVQEYEKGTLIAGESAIIDFLTRTKPRIQGHSQGPIVISDQPEERLQGIIQSIVNLDHSYLAIQGPPGAGKTYTGQHVIAELLTLQYRIGIASNSHAAINNLLLSLAKHCRATGIAATFVCTSDTDPDLEKYGVVISQNNQLNSHMQESCVIGATAWGFSREDMEQQFDYLFVDEAGQVSVANLIAMSRSARNLVLMGDQMQLGQPTQGTHPADSGLSALDYLLHDTATIADDMGVFLSTTYRMHSLVNRFISEHIYEGKLQSNPCNDQRCIEVPDDYQGTLNREAGIVFIPVEHQGNTQAADEEVEAIQEIAKALIGRVFHTGSSQPTTRAIDWNDILFVAPYNHQVSKLQMALGSQAKVGSVDKFQGQEAPIVILSMCSSDASESPRGMHFLFDKQRINVAISRAQSLAVVVGNPQLATTPVNSVEQLKLVNLLSAVIRG